MDQEQPSRPRARRVMFTVVLVALAWSWLLLPRFGGFGEALAVAAPLGFVGILGLHAFAFVVRRRAVIAISAVAWLVSGAVMVGSPRVPVHFATPRQPVTIAAANLRFDNPTPFEAAAVVKGRHADVVVISEGTRVTESVLGAAYRYSERSPHFGSHYSEFVASRYPLRMLAIPAGLVQAVVVEVMAPVPFVLVAVHFPRAGLNLPHLQGQVSFGEQRTAVNAVIHLTNAATMPVVVAGDFNVSDRTAAYHALVSGRRDAMRARWAGSTYRAFPWTLLALRIDHVIIAKSWCATHPERYAPTGSDHDGVQVAIGPCP